MEEKIMFDYTYTFELSKENIASLEIAANPNNYYSPTIKASIAEIQKSINENQHFKNKFYSLCFCSIISQMWSVYATKFAGKSNLIYNSALNCYEFTVAHKIIGETLSITKSNMFGMLGQKRKCIAFLYIKISVIVDGNTIILKSKHYKTIAHQHPVSFRVCPDSEYNFTPFLVKDTTMSMCESFGKKLSNAFYKTLSKITNIFSTIEIFNGDFLDCLNYLIPDTSYSSKDCQVIETVYYMACKVFPLFASLDLNKQIQILENASAETKFEVTSARKYKANFQFSVFAKKLYFEIMKLHLDTIAVLSKFSKTLTMQKWNSSPSHLLYTKKDFEEFDYENCNPDELIWVRYDSSNYSINEIYSKLIPTTGIVNSMKINYFIGEIDSNDSQIS